MKEKLKLVGVIPTTDHAVFVNSKGQIRERIGIAYFYVKNNDDETCEETVLFNGNEFRVPHDLWMQFIDEYGEFNVLPDPPCEVIIGKKGDTVTLNDLRLAFRHSSFNDLYPEGVLDNAKEYFNVSLEELPDTVALFVDLHRGGEHLATIMSQTDKFPNMGGVVCDLAAEDYSYQVDKKSHYWSLKDTYIKILAIYSKLLGKRVNVQIYMKKCTHTFLSEEELKKRNERIFREEESYLPRLRRFINEELDAALANKTKHIRKNEHEQWEEKQLAKKFASKYDMYPTMM